MFGGDFVSPNGDAFLGNSTINGDLVCTGKIVSEGQITTDSLITPTIYSQNIYNGGIISTNGINASGTITSGTISNTGGIGTTSLTASGAITCGTLSASGKISTTANVTCGTLSANGNISTTANVIGKMISIQPGQNYFTNWAFDQGGYIGWNSSNGGGETNFIDSSPTITTTSFLFSRTTPSKTNSAADLMKIYRNGNVQVLAKENAHHVKVSLDLHNE
eukprot:gene8316-17118_t